MAWKCTARARHLVTRSRLAPPSLFWVGRCTPAARARQGRSRSVPPKLLWATLSRALAQSGCCARHYGKRPAWCRFGSDAVTGVPLARGEGEPRLHGCDGCSAHLRAARARRLARMRASACAVRSRLPGACCARPCRLSHGMSHSLVGLTSVNPYVAAALPVARPSPARPAHLPRMACGAGAPGPDPLVGISGFAFQGTNAHVILSRRVRCFCTREARVTRMRWGWRAYPPAKPYVHAPCMPHSMPVRCSGAHRVAGHAWARRPSPYMRFSPGLIASSTGLHRGHMHCSRLSRHLGEPAAPFPWRALRCTCTERRASLACRST